MTAPLAASLGDALHFIFHGQQSVGGSVRVGGSQLWPLLGTHLRVSGEAIALACAISLPAALWLGHVRRGRLTAGVVANVGRAVPSFAVLVFFSAYLGLGITNLVFAMTLLAIPPVFVNAYVGVRQADPDAVDAARGMGMSGLDIVRRVELPMALPLLFGGIRTSTVNVLATATLGPYVGVVTLGDPIINANVYGDAGRLGGALIVAALAVLAELGLAALQRAVTPKGLRLERRSRARRFRPSWLNPRGGTITP